MERRVLFRVREGVEGHEYVIYDNGDIEGFGEGAIVFNYHPTLLGRALAQQIEKGMSSAPVLAASIRTSDLAGAPHVSPE